MFKFMLIFYSLLYFFFNPILLSLLFRVLFFFFFFVSIQPHFDDFHEPDLSHILDSLSIHPSLQRFASMTNLLFGGGGGGGGMIFNSSSPLQLEINTKRNTPSKT